MVMQESRGTRGWKVDTRICNEITLGSSEIRFGSDSGNSVHITVQCKYKIFDITGNYCRILSANIKFSPLSLLQNYMLFKLSPRSLDKMLLKRQVNSQNVQNTEWSKFFKFSKSSKFFKLYCMIFKHV